jgi:hypothetical protein
MYEQLKDIQSELEEQVESGTPASQIEEEMDYQGLYALSELTQIQKMKERAGKLLGLH